MPVMTMLRMLRHENHEFKSSLGYIKRLWLEGFRGGRETKRREREKRGRERGRRERKKKRKGGELTRRREIFITYYFKNPT